MRYFAFNLLIVCLGMIVMKDYIPDLGTVFLIFAAGMAICKLIDDLRARA